MALEEIKGLLDKEVSCGRGEIKAEIDRVIDVIYALFNKKKLGRIWTPHQLYFKFMEFFPKQRNTKEDVLSVSYWPPYPKRRQANDIKETLGGRRLNFLLLTFIFMQFIFSLVCLNQLFVWRSF